MYIRFLKFYRCTDIDEKNKGMNIAGDAAFKLKIQIQPCVMQKGCFKNKAFKVKKCF